MATNDSSKKLSKDKIIKTKKQSIQKLNKIINTATQPLEVKVGKSSIKIEAKKIKNSDKKIIQKREIINDMTIKAIPENIKSAPILPTLFVEDSIQPDEDVYDNTEVYDEGDIASAYERDFILKALQRHKEKLAPETHPDFDGESCITCSNEIPVLRLQMGKIRCVECQEKLEKRKKLYA